MVSSRVFVGGLSYHVRERDIERFFKGYGVIKEILLKKGYCFVVSIFVVVTYAREYVSLEFLLV